jgi:hypothetical protein
MYGLGAGWVAKSRHMFDRDSICGADSYCAKVGGATRLATL